MEGFCKRPGPARPKLAVSSFSSEEAKVSAGCGPRCLAKTCATISSACSAISSECEQAILCRLSVSLLPHLPSSPSPPLSLSPSVHCYPQTAWDQHIDYLYLRNNAPDQHRLSAHLCPKLKSCAYACGCSWLSADAESTLMALGDGMQGLLWACAGHPSGGVSVA